MAWPNFNFHSNTEDSLKNTSTNDSSLQLLNGAAWFVDIEASNDDHFRWSLQITVRHRNLIDGFTNSVDVVLQLRRNWNNRCVGTDGTLDEFLDLLVVFHGSFFILEDDIDLVLEHYDVLQLHDLQSNEMLGGLRLRAVHVGSHKQ